MLKKNVKVRSYRFGLTTVDVDLRDRFAIYLHHKLADLAPEKYVIATIAHELIHVITRQTGKYPFNEIWKMIREARSDIEVDVKRTRKFTIKN